MNLILLIFIMKNMYITLMDFNLNYIKIIIQAVLIVIYIIIENHIYTVY